ncbi:threonine/serine exporter family protein [Streptococcus ferus]|uniref:Membrane protein n=1 Tax=Streptococcus ferus TaxID=1345 RepID=A0A2X3XYD2_9STRE|nr:threonine/serine exporter family protein [Streptococcus ferus]SQF40211.1 membrane protein [Streptococcus ferus]
MELIVGFVFSFLATWGFGIITNVPRRTLLASALTGGVAWTAYLLLEKVTSNLVLPNLGAALLIGFLANVSAVKLKTPVNIMYVPCLVSLVPGAIIYKTMKSFALGDSRAAQGYLVEALTVTVSLALGFLLAETLINKLRKSLKEKKKTVS